MSAVGPVLQVSTGDLRLRCPNCSASQQPDDHFCGFCGLPLAHSPAPDPSMVCERADSDCGDRARDHTGRLGRH